MNRAKLAAMAHPPDRALSRAIGDALKEARAGGRSTRALATYFGVSDPTIIRWENGGHVPALDLLPKFDELVGRRRGEMLRRAGYVEDDPSDVRAAIAADPDLPNETIRQMLLDTYDAAVKRAQASLNA